jgi:peptidoglycan-associated lipoprotein
MKKVLLTVCSLALFAGVGCKNKSQQSTNVADSGTLDSIPKSTFEELEKKVGDRVFFSYDNSGLSDSAKAVLGKQIEFMKENSHLKFVLEGFCDKRGTVEYNLALGERRANSVKKHLVQHGINPDRLIVISFGKERPAVSGDTEEAYKQNRRVVTVIR